eukprot:2828618-Rhodomonas_salina.1
MKCKKPHSGANCAENALSCAGFRSVLPEIKQEKAHFWSTPCTDGSEVAGPGVGSRSIPSGCLHASVRGCLSRVLPPRTLQPPLRPSTLNPEPSTLNPEP